MILYRKGNGECENLERIELIETVSKEVEDELNVIFWYKDYKCEVGPSHTVVVSLNNKLRYVPTAFNGYIYYKNDKRLFWNCPVPKGWTYDNNGCLGYDHAHLSDITISGLLIVQHDERNIFFSQECVVSELKVLVENVEFKKLQLKEIRKCLINTYFKDLIDLMCDLLVGIEGSLSK